MSNQTIPLALAYDLTVGCFLCCSPDLYAKALERMAEMTGRVNDEAFRAEVAEIGRTRPCDLDF